MRRLSAAAAMGRPNSVLMLKATRWALREIGFAQQQGERGEAVQIGSEIASATAPFAMRPTVG